jgi:hypothetical protein
VDKGKAMFGKVRYWPFGLAKKAVVSDSVVPTYPPNRTVKEEGEANLSVISKYLGDDERSNGYLRDATSFMYMGGVETVCWMVNACGVN